MHDQQEGRGNQLAGMVGALGAVGVWIVRLDEYLDGAGLAPLIDALG